MKVEVYNAAGTQVFQHWLDNQSLLAGRPQDFLTAWPVPPDQPRGAHVVRLGVFSPGWAATLAWNDHAARFNVVAGADDPPAIYFATPPPRAALPNGSDCAARVRRSPWEPRPDNDAANHTTGTGVDRIDGVSDAGNALYAGRIDGNFTGTTDEIIQWGACKWGLDENIVRAIAVKESWWVQATQGDFDANTQQYDSYGLLQVRRSAHPNTYPWSAQSTAFNVDYALARRRACYDGYFVWTPASAQGDEWGCVGLWFSGSWYDQGAREYITSVREILAKQIWLQPGF